MPEALPLSSLHQAAAITVQLLCPDSLPARVRVTIEVESRGPGPPEWCVLNRSFLTVGRGLLSPQETLPGPSEDSGDSLRSPTGGDMLRECEADIVDIIRGKDERLTGDAIKLALQKAELIHGDSTVDRALADLVKRRKLLSNRRDSYGKGYGLSEWS